MTAVGRRGVLAAAVGVAALAACSTDAAEQEAPLAVDPHGAEQAGIVRPAQQAFAKLTVLDVRGTTPLPDVLTRLGQEIAALTDGALPAVPVSVRLTVTVGIGPGALPDDRAAMLGLRRLPAFARDRFDAVHDGGGVVLQVCANDAVAVLAATTYLTERFGADLAPRWSQFGFTGVRNVLGFHDGLVQPRDRELDDGVWITEGGRRSSLLVVRRIVLDTAAFERLGTTGQEAVIGRTKATGAPLSGGGSEALPDLTAKTPAGAYLIPSGAHVRRAHPLATGRPLMLRRGYSFADGDDSGLLFLSYQRTLESFVQTQFRLDAGDELNAFTRVTASGVFWMLPGYDAARGLGEVLRRRPV